MNWLRKQMELRGLNQREVADWAGMTEQMFTNVVQGRRIFKAAEVDAIRRKFGFRLPEDNPPSVTVKFVLSCKDEIVDRYLNSKEPYFEVARPQWIPNTEVCAAEIRGDTAEPMALHGDILFWEPPSSIIPQSSIARPAVVKIKGGPICFKILTTGRSPYEWNLISLNPRHKNIFDVEVDWVSRALVPLHRDEARHH